MDSLERHDLLHLAAAKGWLGLRTPVEAEAESAQITPAMRWRTDVLTVRCEVCVHTKRWDEGAEVAEAQALEDPDLEPLRKYLKELTEA